MGNGGLLGLHRHEDQMYQQELYIIDDDTTEDEHTDDDDLEMENIALGVCIEGAVGIFSPHINTCFIQTGSMYNGRMLYQSFPTPITGSGTPKRVIGW